MESSGGANFRITDFAIRLLVMEVNGQAIEELNDERGLRKGFYSDLSDVVRGEPPFLLSRAINSVGRPYLVTGKIGRIRSEPLGRTVGEPDMSRSELI